MDQSQFCKKYSQAQPSGFPWKLIHCEKVTLPMFYIIFCEGDFAQKVPFSRLHATHIQFVLVHDRSGTSDWSSRVELKPARPIRAGRWFWRQTNNLNRTPWHQFNPQSRQNYWLPSLWSEIKQARARFLLIELLVRNVNPPSPSQVGGSWTETHRFYQACTVPITKSANESLR